MAILIVEFSTAYYYYYSRLSPQDLFLDTLSLWGPVSFNVFSEKRAFKQKIFPSLCKFCCIISNYWRFEAEVC